LIERLKKAEPNYTIQELCSVFGIGSSSYYYQPNKVNDTLAAKVITIFDDSNGIYGRRRVHFELQKAGFDVGIYKTASIMKTNNLNAIKPTKRHYYPDSGVEHKYASNLLKRQFKPDTHNTHWVGDITYIRNYQGWSYLACVLDLATNEIVGQAMSKHPNSELALEALNKAIQLKKPNTGKLLFHSDQGVQYSSNVFRNKLKALNITQSMSRRGNCWDNAIIERFFRSLKTEKLNHLSFINHESVMSNVSQYINFYNYKRIHSAIDYKTPHEKFNEMKKVA
jgi:transposase InsO family protein